MKTPLKIKRNKDTGIVIKNFPGYFLITCLIFSFFGLFTILRPFIVLLVLAAILGTAFHPLYHRLVKLFKGRVRLASLVTCFLVFILIIVPLIVFLILLGAQAFDTYNFIQHQVHNGTLDPYLRWQSGGLIYDFVNSLRGQLGTLVDLDTIDLKGSITESAQLITSVLATQSASILKGLGGLLLNFFLMFFAMYYFFKDGHWIVKKIMVLSPLPENYEREIFRKFKEISLATLYGIFLTSMMQGFIGGVGFAIVGIPGALFWGTAMGVFSLIPFVGTLIIWLPASLILLASGNIVGGIFLFLWGLLLVSTVDNFLRAYLIGGKTNTNQLLTFLAIFGGVGVFGLVGVVFGPLILTFFFTFLHIYEMEYDRVLHHH